MSSAPAMSSGPGGCTSSRVRPTSASLRAYVSLRRTRSIARCLAVAVSQAPGRSGTPDSGHCSSAATRASCASSSAMPTSRTMRATPAMIRADSILNTASTAAVALASVTATHQSSRSEAEQARPGGGREGVLAQPSAISRTSAVTVQLSGWTSRNRLVHSSASALSLHCMRA